MALPEFAIEAYTDAGDIVFEPFGGSGTTMLAAAHWPHLAAASRSRRSTWTWPSSASSKTTRRAGDAHRHRPIFRDVAEIATEREMEVAA